MTIDIDPTLITSHSDKEGAAGTYKGGYGFHPLHAYGDATREALAAKLRPGNAGANTAEDHKAVLDLALEQTPAEHIEEIEILVRADRAGATHELADYCQEGRMRFSFGYDLTDSVVGSACPVQQPPHFERCSMNGAPSELRRWPACCRCA